MRLSVSPFTGSPVAPRFVSAAHRIEQSPTSGDPAVPRGAVGSVEDIIDEDYGFLLAVDFGAPYGVVLCEPSEVRA